MPEKTQRKRKSLSSGQSDITQFAKISKGDASAAPEHVTRILQWLKESVIPRGGPDRWLEKAYPDEASLLDFARWLDKNFEMDPRTAYATNLNPGPQYLRVWQLSFRADFGLPSMICPDSLLTLVEMILMSGFKTNAEVMPGVEKLAVFQHDTSFLTKPYTPLPPLHRDSDLLRPFSVAFVKGWRRSLSCLIALEGSRKLQIPFDRLTDQFKESLSVVYGVVGQYGTIRDVVSTHRSVTAASTATRRPANCFNFLRQLQVLEKAGDESVATFTDWDDDRKVMRWFQLGKLEAQSVTNLRQHVDSAVLKELWAAVKPRGMKTWLSHEVIAKELFNVGYTSATGAWDAWKSECINPPRDHALVRLCLQRLETDWDRALTKKCWNYKEAQALHAVCGVFLSVMETLQKSIPERDFEENFERVKEQFHSGFLDSQLQTLLETAAPPVNLHQVQFIRPIVLAVDERQQREVEEEQRELAEKFQRATCDQLLVKVQADFLALKGRAPTKETEAAESLLDAKYLKDRQRTGQEWCQKTMDEKFKLQLVDAALSGALTDFSKFCSGKAANGRVLTLALVDFTLFPADATYTAACLEIVKACLTMSAETCAHIQLPVVQSNTSPAAVLKNRRKIEDALGSASLDVLNSVTQLYDKSEARSNDNRKTVQPAMVVTFTAHHANPWHQSNAFTTGTIGPAKLIAVANMLGVDREHGPPSVGARTEQKGLHVHHAILDSYLGNMEFQDADQVVLLDVCPNRQAEFARAALERLLALRKPEVHYYGMLREEQEDVKTQLGTQLYNHWDQSSEAPPKVRPREALEAPVLQALAWNNGEVHFPDQLLNKFPANSQERSDMLKIKHELADFFRSSMPVVKKEELESSPAAKPGTVPAVSPGRGPAPRAVGRPDWSIEDGARPVQCDAPIRLEHVPAASFGVTRLAQTAMTKNKPTLVVSSTFELWVGNEGHDEITVTRDIMGFHKGDYSEKVVAGDGSGERNAVCFRLLSDKDIVSHENVFMSLADYFHFLSATKGVAEVELMNHVMKQKTYPETPAAADGDDTQCQTDPLPVPYRYNLTALKSGLCTVFKPAALSSDEAGESKTVRAGSLGAVFVGQMDKLPRTKHAGIVWEVEINTGAAVPMITPVKPRFCLFGQLTLPAQTWVKL